MVAAFFAFGFLKAGTPLEIASTPVSAAEPDENARSSRNTSRMPVLSWVPSSWNPALSASIGSVPKKYRIRPVTSMAKIATMKA